MASSAQSIQATVTDRRVVARDITVCGRVQSVGFRPFVWRLAQRLEIAGWVHNRSGDVVIHAQGTPTALQRFQRALIDEAPPLARPRIGSSSSAVVVDQAGFSIHANSVDGAADVNVPPDLFTCDECLAELTDPQDRRFRYPFVNCTQCGPRYTLIRALPYDRANTTMAGFELCTACRDEYQNPADRRFHAEPIACPDCGPTLSFGLAGSEAVITSTSALDACVDALRDGQVVAVKGVGGYHLLCDARSETAIARLRQRKPRPHKPLAVMFPAPASDPLGAARQAVLLNARESELLVSGVRPIVLAERRADCRLPGAIAPGLNEIGVMLPYSPLHHLLLDTLQRPLVATSANITGEPVLSDNDQAQSRLGHVADAFLHHDRPIQRPADDPVYRFVRDQAQPLRLGRGVAPLELQLPFMLEEPVLAVGGQLKNTVALAWGDRVVVSPHIGDMGSVRSLVVFEQVIDELQSLYGISATAIICDAHPDYATTRWAQRSGLPIHEVFHHYAHAAAMAAAEPDARWLVFTWDGVGYGADATLWGGEALLGKPGDWRRGACLRPFRLPGGERAGREPWRSAASVCWEAGYEWRSSPQPNTMLRQAWERRLNTPQTTAAGRLFDAAAALTGLCLDASYEGQAAMLLEAACSGNPQPVHLPLSRDGTGMWVTNWAPLLPMLLDEAADAGERAACFHASLACALLAQARCLRAEHGIERVGLSGGVFQNRVLTRQVAELLAEDEFSLAASAHIPVNDAGLSFGQVIEYGSRATRRKAAAVTSEQES